MMKWQIFKKTTKACLGLDISRTDIKLIHLVREANRLSIRQALKIEIPLNDTTTDHTVQTIKQLVRRANTTCCDVVTALSDSSCLTQIIQLSQNTANWKVDALVQATLSVPLPLDTLYFDFQPLHSPGNDPKILGVFCRKTTVHQKAQLVKNSDLKLVALELESHALERSFDYLYQLQQYPKYWSCILINQTHLTLLVWSQQTVLGSFSDTLETPHSLLGITSQVQQHLMQLLGAYTHHPLEALWVIGDHALCGPIQEQARKRLGLLQHPPILRREQSIKLPLINFEPFYIAFGLALRRLISEGI